MHAEVVEARTLMANHKKELKKAIANSKVEFEKGMTLLKEDNARIHEQATKLQKEYGRYKAFAEQEILIKDIIIEKLHSALDSHKNDAKVMTTML